MKINNPEILSVKQIYDADRLTIEGGILGFELMQNAGSQIANEIIKTFHRAPTLILCGPGNNGGDGFIVAQILKAAGWPITMFLLGSADDLKGDAKLAFDKWEGKTSSFEEFSNNKFDLIIDGLFGVGLNKAPREIAKRILDWANNQKSKKIAIDIPSGIDGDTGEKLKVAFQANETHTFFRKKIGHILGEGREYSGRIKVLDIGISEKIIKKLGPTIKENSIEYWKKHFPNPDINTHKYKRGHSLVLGGPSVSSGASRLAARAALRVGAGLVTTAFPEEALDVYASHQTAVMNAPYDKDDIPDIITGNKIGGFLIGPGHGVGDKTIKMTLAILNLTKPTVLDADALTSFENCTTELFKYIHPDTIITPHEGEFKKLFPKIDINKNRVSGVKESAKLSGGIVVLKGPETIISSPEGEVIINTHGSPYLATAGSGDVLAGIILGLITAGMPSLKACAAATWIHGQCGKNLGIGLISEDLVEQIPFVLKDIFK